MDILLANIKSFT